MFQMSKKVINFITTTKKNWNVQVTAGEQRIEEGIFKVDSLSTLLFVIARIHLIYKEMQRWLSFKKLQEKINHLMRLDEEKYWQK